MKKQIVMAMLAMTLAATSLTGCGASTSDDAAATETTTSSATSDADDATAEEDTQIANPWTETDQTGLLKATGYTMTPPEDASDVAYSYMAESGLAQMTYTTDNDTDWTYRIQAADKLTDISGISTTWDYEGQATVAGLDGKDYSCGDINEDNVDHYQMIQWYDAVTGTTYSLAAHSLHDLGGMDIQAVAESIYQPLQQDVTDDAAADAERELTDYFLGDFTSSYDGSTLSISDNGNDTYTVDASLSGAMAFTDTSATFSNHKIIWSDTESGASGMIYRDSDNSLVVSVETTGESFPEFTK